MEPTSIDLQRLALYDPIAAYGILLGLKRVPFHIPISATFSSFTVPQQAIQGNQTVTLAQRTWIEKINYSLALPNCFAGNIFKPQFDAYLKMHPGISVQLAVLSGPRYLTSPVFVALENMADMFNSSWPAGWPLDKLQALQMTFQLTQAPATAPNVPPYNVEVVFTCWQFLDQTIDNVSEEEAREALRRAGLCTPLVCRKD
jgi:hypothetical protein